MRIVPFVGLLSVALLGAGCTGTTSYLAFSDQDSGVAFDIPAGATMFSDGVNGFDNTWKFVYNDDSYTVTLYEYKNGEAKYAAWDGVAPEGTPETVVDRTDGKEIFSLEGTAYTESFIAVDGGPSASILVSKHEGSALTGEQSSSDDAIFTHLVASVTYHSTAAF